MKKIFAILSKFFGVGLLLILIVILIFDFNKLKLVLTQANYSYLFLALISSLISVTLAALGFVIAANIFQVDSDFRRRFKAGWLGVAMNNLIMSGGAVGYGIRIKLLESRKTRTKQIIGASLFYSYIFQLFMVVVLPICLLYFYNSQIVFPSIVRRLILAGIVISLIMVVFFSSVFFISRFRRYFFSKLSVLFFKLFKKNWQNHFLEIDELLSDSLSMGNIASIVLLLFSVAADWVFCTAALFLAFLALGVHVSVLFLFCAFVVSVAIGYISVLPGGLGTQDLSLTGILVLGGYDLHIAILASILFRLIYYIIPYAFATLYYNFSK
ncbi:MAG: flippase-like domain-containing protein [bacterium]